MGAGARGARAVCRGECAGGVPAGAGSTRQGGPAQRQRAGLLLHLNMQRNSGRDGVEGPGGFWWLHLGLLKCKAPAKVQVCT